MEDYCSGNSCFICDIYYYGHLFYLYGKQNSNDRRESGDGESRAKECLYFSRRI